MALSTVVVAAVLAAPTVLGQALDNYGLVEASRFGLPTVNLVDFISRLVRIFLAVVVVVVILMIILAGFRWMLSGGDEEKRKKAQSALINAIIGLVIIFLAYAIVSFVINALVGSGAGTVSTRLLN